MKSELELNIGRGATIFGVEGLQLNADERAFLREADPFGIILFARNVDTPEQLSALTTEIRLTLGRQAPIMIDQEGGRVQRLRAPHWRNWEPPYDLVARAPDLYTACHIMSLQAQLIGAELQDVGIDANCAPIADVASGLTHPFLKNRCYGESAQAVAAIAGAVADAYLQMGVLPVLKHLPGHGRATADSHLELPRVDAELDALEQIDFAAFKPLNHLPMAMTAHIVFTAIDPHLPATQSPKMMQIIRENIDFQGLLMTDDLNMEALSGSLAQRTSAAIEAGCDIALHCNGDLAQMQDVAAAAGTMNARSKERALRALAHRRSPQEIDIKAIAAEFDTLTRV